MSQRIDIKINIDDLTILAVSNPNLKLYQVIGLYSRRNDANGEAIRANSWTTKERTFHKTVKHQRATLPHHWDAVKQCEERGVHFLHDEVGDDNLNRIQHQVLMELL